MGDERNSDCPGALDPSRPEFRADPYRVYRWYREHDPVHCRPGANGGTGARWMLTRYADVLEFIDDERLGREPRRRMWTGEGCPVAGAHLSFADTIKEWVIFRDPPDHARLRRGVNQVINPELGQRLRPRIEELAHELIDAMEGRDEVDLMAEYAVPLPLRVIGELFGLGAEHAIEIRACSIAIMQALGGGYSFDRVARAGAAIESLRGLLGDGRPGGGLARGELFDRLEESLRAEGGFREEEIMPTAVLLLVAGNDNSVSLIGNAIWTLWHHPEQKQKLTETPGLLGCGVNEVLRFESPVQLVSRDATADLEIGGKRVRPGDAVTFLLGAANRDPEIFERPEEFDVTRSEAHRHRAFGVGIHACPGGWLGKLEAEIALGVLLERRPHLELADVDDAPAWREMVNFRGLERLKARP